MGVHSPTTPWKADASFAQDLYERFAAPRESRYFLTTPRYWFRAEKKLTWREFFANET
jgi:hypothetical protein